MGREIFTRAEAKARGLVAYFTGRPCASGHLAERFTKNKNCRECTRLRVRRWQKAHPGWMANWRLNPKNKERERATRQRYYQKHRGRILQREREKKRFKYEHDEVYRAERLAASKRQRDRLKVDVPRMEKKRARERARYWDKLFRLALLSELIGGREL